MFDKLSPKALGAAMADGFWDRIVERVGQGLMDAVDSLAFITMMSGAFLYLLGVKKGGQISWGSIAIWITIKAFLLSL